MAGVHIPFGEYCYTVHLIFQQLIYYFLIFFFNFFFTHCQGGNFVCVGWFVGPSADSYEKLLQIVGVFKTKTWILMKTNGAVIYTAIEFDIGISLIESKGIVGSL